VTVKQGFMVDGPVEFDEAVEFAAEHDFDFLELNAEFAFHRRRIDPARIRGLARERGLGLVVHLPYRLDAGSPHEHVREGACQEIEAAIDAAVELGASKGVAHATSRANLADWGVETLRDSLYESVRRLYDYARERDFSVCVENVKQDLFDAGDFPDLFAETEAAACLDTGHAYARGHGAPAQAELLETYPDRIDHVHLNETRRDDVDEHLPLGLGHVDFEALATAMREADWAGTCTHEVWAFDLDSRAHSKRVFDQHLAGADRR